MITDLPNNSPEEVRPIFLLMFVASISASTTLEYFANEGCTGSPAKYGYEISGLCYELRPYRSVRVNPGDGERLYFFDDAAGCFSHLDNTMSVTNKTCIPSTHKYMVMKSGAV
ncbi:hypothetical protein N7512_003509 [Penicillium capsulatum]|nr:hypothetical protein N7512_003509 [Penicillium capsulatum]